MPLPYSSSAGLPFGGITPTINGTTFVARNWAPARSSRKIRRDDENGDQAAFQLRVEPTSQSGLVLQVPLANSALPLMGNTFTVSNVNYVVTAVSPQYSQGEFWLVNIDYDSVALPSD
jgi:hypothetical protein